MAPARSRSQDAVDDVFDSAESRQRIDDLRSLEASTTAAGWTIEYKQLDAGPAVSESTGSEIGEVSLLFERHSSPIECVGETPKGAVTLVVPEFSGRAVMNGRLLNEGEIAVFGPGTEIDGVTHGAQNAWNVHIPVERFIADREALGLDQGGFRADGAQFLVVRAKIRPSALSTLPLRSRLGRTPHAPVETAAELIQEAAASVAIEHRERERSPSSHRAIRAAREYIHAHLAEPIRIPEVCRAAGVRQRTLERRFRATYGLSPKGYIQACRLNAVHRTLTDPSGCEATVTEVAARFGFTHLGRFAGAYRAYFGRLPREVRKSAFAGR